MQKMVPIAECVLVTSRIRGVATIIPLCSSDYWYSSATSGMRGQEGSSSSKNQTESYGPYLLLPQIGDRVMSLAGV